MKKVKSISYFGKQLLARYQSNIGYYLSDVYDRYSYTKANAYEYCFNQFAKDETAQDFHIISANTFNFSVGWTCSQGVRIETSTNSYLVTF